MRTAIRSRVAVLFQPSCSSCCSCSCCNPSAGHRAARRCTLAPVRLRHRAYRAEPRVPYGAVGSCDCRIVCLAFRPPGPSARDVDDAPGGPLSMAAAGGLHVCPVCSRTFPTLTNAGLNAHINACVDRGGRPLPSHEEGCLGRAAADARARRLAEVRVPVCVSRICGAARMRECVYRMRARGGGGGGGVRGDACARAAATDGASRPPGCAERSRGGGAAGAAARGRAALRACAARRARLPPGPRRRALVHARDGL